MDSRPDDPVPHEALLRELLPEAALADTAETCSAAVVRVRCGEPGDGVSSGGSSSGGYSGASIGGSGGGGGSGLGSGGYISSGGVAVGGDVGGDGGGVLPAAVLAEESVGPALAACEAAGLADPAECLEVVAATGARHCNAAAAANGAVASATVASAAATAAAAAAPSVTAAAALSGGAPRYHSFPIGAERRSPGDFTVAHLAVERLDEGDPGAVAYVSLPLFPTAPARRAGAAAVAAGFCARRRWASCGALAAFLADGLEAWVAEERSRALRTADELLADIGA